MRLIREDERFVSWLEKSFSVVLLRIPYLGREEKEDEEKTREELCCELEGW